MAPFLDGLVAFEPYGSVVHLLQGSAELVWQACSEGLTVDDLSSAVAEAAGLEAARVEADVLRFVDRLRDQGLVARSGPPPERPRVSRSPVEGRHRSRALAVLDERVVLRSSDASLIEQVEAGFGTTGDPPTIEYALSRVADGSLRLEGRDGGLPIAAGQLLAGVVGEMNQVAAASSSLLALHAGAVRSPSGAVVLLPAPSESGKSTLTANLLRAGWDYLGDEAIGVRPGTLVAVPYPKPLSLRPVSREALGLGGSANPVPVEQVEPGARVLTGDAGPVSAVVVPRFVEGELPHEERLEPDEALGAVAENVFNLVAAGQVALDTLVDLVVKVPVHRLAHGGGPGVVAAVERIVGGAR